MKLISFFVTYWWSKRIFRFILIKWYFYGSKKWSVFVVDYLFIYLLIIIILESQNRLDLYTNEIVIKEFFFPFADSNSLIRLKERVWKMASFVGDDFSLFQPFYRSSVEKPYINMSKIKIVLLKSFPCTVCYFKSLMKKRLKKNEKKNKIQAKFLLGKEQNLEVSAKQMEKICHVFFQHIKIIRSNMAEPKSW